MENTVSEPVPTPDDMEHEEIDPQGDPQPLSDEEMEETA